MRAMPTRNVEVIDASATDVATRVRELTGGKGADIVFNTVGDPYFEAAHKSLALRGRQILIAAVDRIVQFNILEFYRGQHTYVGIDTLGLSSVATGAVLRELGPGFASGHLKPFPIKPSAIYPLEQAKAAFIAVAGSSRDRVILRPRKPRAFDGNKSLRWSAATFLFPDCRSCERFILCIGRPWTYQCFQRNSSTEIASYLSNDGRVRGARAETPVLMVARLSSCPGC